MTNKEALNILNKGIAPNPTANNECIELCKKALEKQIPQKISVLEMPCEAIYSCPNCHKQYIGRENYCSNCGQAIDWSNAE